MPKNTKRRKHIPTWLALLIVIPICITFGIPYGLIKYGVYRPSIMIHKYIKGNQ